VQCPQCGSRFLTPSHPRNFNEKVQSLWFVMPVRCDHCRHRFITDTMGLADLVYARCPKCNRMDLNTWTGESCPPRGITKFKTSLGANKFRCEYCRLNFASFRKRKEVFSFHRWERIEAATKAAAGDTSALDKRAGLERKKITRHPPQTRREEK
jgi:hypothetical protein